MSAFNVAKELQNYLTGMMVDLKTRSISNQGKIQLKHPVVCKQFHSYHLLDLGAPRAKASKKKSNYDCNIQRIEYFNVIFQQKD